MANVTVVGSQWGDEGKGKIVDWLSERADVIARFQGGHNAGHTLVIDGVTYALSLLPSGIVREDKFSVVGNGVVVDPWAFVEEVARIAEKGIAVSPDRLMIAENAVLILPMHVDLDRRRERQRGNDKIGTTGRGIGPAYEDKVGRRAVRVGDLRDPELVSTRLVDLLQHHNAIAKGMGEPEYNLEDMHAQLMAIAPSILPFVGPVWRELQLAQKTGKKILFEGAQGTMLDVDHGTYPFVTSSNIIAGQASTGTGLSPKDTGFVLGITKAYTTRVGSGPFPTELEDADGALLGERGHEFGVVTGRKRRCGWFDAVMVRQALSISGVNGIAFTKLDVLDAFKTIKICVGYRLNGEMIDYHPSDANAQASVEPVYEHIDGWESSTYGVQNFEDLPEKCVDYIRRVEVLIGVKVALLSTSPKREDVVVIQNPFDDVTV